ncbi:MAG: ABC transporter permease [Lachnospiraceae bacterium]|nr:ABC transporter permease [Lachnospiraceae bacterium]
MATYNLNELLKNREAQNAPKSAADHAFDRQRAGQGTGTNYASGIPERATAVALDDVSRVKVLSPGRQVLKRFVRNRLAVTGTLILLTMFVFSFLGPLVYPYGQKQIFYKFDSQNVNYALAKVNTAYNGYDVNTDAELERSVVNAMNSNIKKMIADGKEDMVLVTENGSYQIRQYADNIYPLDTVEMEKIGSVGSGTVQVGTYSMVGKNLEGSGAQIPGLAEAAAKNCKGASGSFTVDGVEYTFTKGSKPKSFDIFAEQDGFAYTGEAMDEGFEEAVNEAIENGETSLLYEDVSYSLQKNKGMMDIYASGEATVAKVYTTYTVDTMETGLRLSDQFRAGALMAAGEEGTGEFEADGKAYTVKDTEEGLIIYDAQGNEFAELDSFSIRRYSGEDTMAYDLKKTIAGKIESMLESGEKSGTVTAGIPAQNEDGSYTTDEEGNYILNDTEMKITQRLEGEYVINCDQINYVIDIFGAPSAAHILGTDGDGFDVMSRIMYGGRVSLMVGFIVVFIETILGVIMGGIAGYFGGWVDNLIMRLVDIFYCLPSMPIMIILGAMMDAIRLDTYLRLMVMMAALGLMGWAGVARMVRGQILSLREQEFMVATEATGIRIKDRIFKHLVPNVMPQLIVISTMSLGGVIITESTLSYLGLGVKHPLATWGTIINSVSSASAMAHYAFIWIPVGLLICLTVIAFNFVGDGLRDAYDPKAKR